MTITDLLSELGYEESNSNWIHSDPQDTNQSFWFREARAVKGVYGAYVFRTSPKAHEILSPKPAVFVAQAESINEARIIHRHLWNLGNAPYIIVVLPSQIRVYYGFSYDPDDEQIGLVSTGSTLKEIQKILKHYSASSIDSGELWSTTNELPLNNRIDTHLLRNLDYLGEQLIEQERLPRSLAHALIGKYIYM